MRLKRHVKPISQNFGIVNHKFCIVRIVQFGQFQRKRKQNARLDEYAIQTYEVKIKLFSKHKLQLQWKTFAKNVKNFWHRLAHHMKMIFHFDIIKFISKNLLYIISNWEFAQSFYDLTQIREPPPPCLTTWYIWMPPYFKISNKF